MLFSEIFEAMRVRFGRFSLLLIDQYHILFKSAPLNHLRIQNATKNSDGTSPITLKFTSYTSLKRYQKKMRFMTASLSLVMLIAITRYATMF
jgi:hypothetical protein